MRTLYVHIPVYDHILGEKCAISPFPFGVDNLEGTFDTLYFGSGHPIAWGVENIRNVIGSYSTPFSDVSLEVNETISKELLDAAVASGVNRFVFGLNDALLIESMISHLRTYPFVSIALDLHLNADNLEWLRTLDVDHVACDPEGLTQEVYETLIGQLHEIVVAKGMTQDGYHLFSRPGHESQYLNAVYHMNLIYEVTGETELTIRNKDVKAIREFDYLYFRCHLVEGILLEDYVRHFGSGLPIDLRLQIDPLYYEMSETHFRITSLGYLHFDHIIALFYNYYES